MTKEENRLWYRFLKKYPVQFKRQVTCGQYILDFYCPKAKLVVELDGSYHKASSVAVNDIIRENYLKSLDLFIIRFPNMDIWKSFDRVCGQIDHLVKERTSSA